MATDVSRTGIQSFAYRQFEVDLPTVYGFSLRKDMVSELVVAEYGLHLSSLYLGTQSRCFSYRYRIGRVSSTWGSPTSSICLLLPAAIGLCTRNEWWYKTVELILHSSYNDTFLPLSQRFRHSIFWPYLRVYYIRKTLRSVIWSPIFIPQGHIINVSIIIKRNNIRREVTKEKEIEQVHQSRKGQKTRIRPDLFNIYSEVNLKKLACSINTRPKGHSR